MGVGHKPHSAFYKHVARNSKRKSKRTAREKQGLDTAQERHLNPRLRKGKPTSPSLKDVGLR